MSFLVLSPLIISSFGRLDQSLLLTFIYFTDFFWNQLNKTLKFSVVRFVSNASVKSLMTYFSPYFFFLRWLWWLSLIFLILCHQPIELYCSSHLESFLIRYRICIFSLVVWLVFRILACSTMLKLSSISFLAIKGSIVLFANDKWILNKKFFEIGTLFTNIFCAGYCL